MYNLLKQTIMLLLQEITIVFGIIMISNNTLINNYSFTICDFVVGKF